MQAVSLRDYHVRAVQARNHGFLGAFPWGESSDIVYKIMLARAIAEYLVQ